MTSRKKLAARELKLQLISLDPVPRLTLRRFPKQARVLTNGVERVGRDGAARGGARRANSRKAGIAAAEQPVQGRLQVREGERQHLRTVPEKRLQVHSRCMRSKKKAKRY